MSDWMTRQEAADYLKISIRQLTNLRLPRVMLGRLPRYSRAAIDQHLELHTTRAGGRRKGGLLGPPLQYPTPVDGEEIIRQQKLKLLRLQRHRPSSGRA